MATKNTKNTPVAQNTPADTSILYAHYEHDIVNFAIEANPFKGVGATVTNIVVNPEHFTHLKRAESVPEGTTVGKTVRDALLIPVRRQCKALTKADVEARNERLRKAEYTFAAYEAERITLAYSPAAKLAHDSEVQWELRCNAKRIDADMGAKAPTKPDALDMSFPAPEGGVLEQAHKLYEAMVDRRQGKTGAMGTNEYDRAVAQFYAGSKTHTVTGRRMVLLKGCVPTSHTLEATVKDADGKRVRKEVDVFGADTRSEFRARFYSLLFANDKVIAETEIK